MRGLPLAVIAAGCGRYGFDMRVGGDDGGAADVPGDAAAPPMVYLASSIAGTTDILTIDATTGQLTPVGTVASPTVIGGLAAWDANTLYAAGVSTMYRITLSPFAAQPVTFTGAVASLARANDVLVGCDDSTNELLLFPPGGAIIRRPLTDPGGGTIVSGGGDVEQLSDGTWLLFTNSTTTLYRLDLATGVATALGPSTGAPYISGMFRDSNDRVFLTSGASDQVIEISATTGQLGVAVDLCLACPTPFDLRSGDATRWP